MKRLVITVCGTSHELYMARSPFDSQDVVLNITTGEIRKGPGTWAELEPLAREATIDASVRVATASNTNISSGLNNGDTVDGVVVATGDRVLLMGQSSAYQNGVYVVGVTGIRATDFNTWDEHVHKVVQVEEGTYTDQCFECNVAKGGTLGSTTITWRRIHIGPVRLDRTAQFTPVATVTPLGTDLVLVQRADGSMAKVLISAIGTLVNV